eukprot:TRINITY_DN31610_c0_g1_i2.p1 TRINITY_DN31610_c0_g1~~TRINITY_DN31610_c0_g1_i2.p1  ORF type:complete len:1219 (-),score=238.63 TRINITY_DN31610_c0_g1_i2:258-3914(-)
MANTSSKDPSSSSVAPSGSLIVPRKQDPTISKATFEQWTQDCGVRKVESNLDDIAEAAKQNGRTLQEELRHRGFKDFAHFQKSCPRFKTFCWPSEFGELGSGYVLYFHFLVFLMIVFFLQLLFQIPAMASYGSATDKMADWRWHDWSKAWSAEDAEACACIGNATGFASSCGAWDQDLCQRQDNCTFDVAKAGLFLCQRWCYANEFCPTRDKGSLSNVHIKTSEGHRGLVKSYSACSQDESLLQLCKSDFRSKDTPYGLDDVDAPIGGLFVGFNWLSAGNPGPNQSNDASVPPAYTCCVVVMCVLILGAYSGNVLTDNRINAQITSPNDFSVMVKGLPHAATDEEDIAIFFREHAVKGKNDTEIVKVVIGWNMEKYRDSLKLQRKLIKEYKQLDPKEPKAEEIKQKIIEVRKKITEIKAGDMDQMKSSGAVVVTFRYQHDQMACLDRWSTFWGTYFGCEARDIGLLWRENQLCRGPALPLFPVAGRPVAKLTVAQAPEPGDIKWTELSVPFNERVKRLAMTNGVMFLLLCISFSITYGVRKATEDETAMKKLINPGNLHAPSWGGEASSNLFFTLGLSVLCGVTNAGLSFAAKKLGDFEFHDTVSEEEFSKALKVGIGMTLNTGGILFFMYTTPQEWYVSGGLVDGAWSLLAMNCIIPPLIPFLDMGYKLRGMVRKTLTGELLDHMNKVVEAVRDPAQRKDPELQKEFKNVQGLIERFKNAWAPSQLILTKRYASTTKTFLCCMLYQPVSPLFSLLGLVALALQYWVDKRLLLNWYKRPDKPVNADMANYMVMFVKIVAPVGLSVSFYIFLTPTYEDKSLVMSSFISSVVVGALFSFLCPLTIWMRAWFALPCNKATIATNLQNEYFNAQHMWAKEMKYHKDHPLYKLIAESKNPEILEPGKVSHTLMGDMTVTGLGDDEEASGGEVTRMRGGRVSHDGEVEAAADAGEVAADAGGGGSSGGVAITVASAPTPSPRPGPAASDDPGTLPGSVADSSTEDPAKIALVAEKIDSVDGELQKETGMNPNKILEGFKEIEPLWPPVASSAQLKTRLAHSFDTLKKRMASSCAEAAADDNDQKLKALVTFARKYDGIQESLGSCSPGFCDNVVRAGASQDFADAESELEKEKGMNPMLVLKNIRNLKLYWEELGDPSSPEVSALHDRLGKMCSVMRGRISDSYEESPEKRPALLKFAESFDASIGGLAGACEPNLKAELEAKG